MIKKIVFGLIIFFLLIAAGIFAIVSHAINADSFREQLIASIQDLTGRTVTAEDPQLVWRPEPMLILKNVTLSNVKDAKQPNMLVVEEVQIRIEWTSLFENPARIKRVVLRRPELFVEKVKGNKTNLHFTKLFKERLEVSSDSFLGSSVQPMKIDLVEIIDGSVHYIDADRSVDDIWESVHGTIRLQSLNGPLSFNGRSSFNGIPLDISVNLGEMLISHPIAVNGKIVEPTSLTTIDFFGNVLPDDKDKSFELDGSFNSAKPNALLKLLDESPLPITSNSVVKGNFKMSWSPARVRWDNVTLRFGSDKDSLALNANWVYNLVEKSVAGQLTITVLDYDTWKTFGSSEKVIQAFQKINSISGEVAIEQVIAKNNKIENIKGSIKYEKDTVQVQNASAQLPGGTIATGDVSVQFKPEKMISGRVGVTTDSARDLLNFLSVDISKISDVNLLKKGNVKGSFKISDDQQKIIISKLVLDDVVGAGTYTAQKDKNVVIDATLQNINMDAYTGHVKPDKVQPIEEEINILTEKIKTLKTPSVPVAIQTYIKNAIWHNVPIATIMCKVSITSSELSGSVSLKDIMSANVDTKFEIQYAGTENWSLSSSETTFSTSQLDVFLRRFGWTTGDSFWDNAKQFSMDVNLSGNPKEWIADGRFKRQNMDSTFKGKIIPGGVQDMNITIQHPEFRTFVRWMDDQFSLFPRLGGALVFSGEVSGNSKKIDIKNMDLRIGDQMAKGSISYVPESKTIEADLTGDSINLIRFLPNTPAIYTSENGFSSRPLDLKEFDPWTVNLTLKANQIYYQSVDLKNVYGQFELKNQSLTARKLSAVWGNAAKSLIQTTGQLVWKESVPKMNLDIQVNNVPVRPGAVMIDTIGVNKGVLDLNLVGTFTGKSPLEMVENSMGQGSFALLDADWHGIDEAKALSVIQQAIETQTKPDVLETQLNEALTTGTTPVQKASGTFVVDKGTIKFENGDIAMPSGGVSNIQMKYAVPTGKVNGEFVLTLNNELPGVMYRINNENKLEYVADVKPLVAVLERKVADIQKQQAARQLQEKQDQKFILLKNKQVEAQREVGLLKDRLTAVGNDLMQIPDAKAGELWKQAQNIFLGVSVSVNKNLQNVEAYASILEQVDKANGLLSQAENIMLNRDIASHQAQINSFLAEADKMILNMTNFYNNKKQLSILGGLLQGSQEQRAIIYRASEQLQRPLSPQQVQTVYKIIDEAFAKIQQAYQYAYDVYTGKKPAPESSSISVGTR